MTAERYDKLEPSIEEWRLAERADMVSQVQAARLVGGTLLAAVSLQRLQGMASRQRPGVIVIVHPQLGARYPKWQFGQRVWPVVQQLAMALDTLSGATMLHWLETPLGPLNGRTPRAALEQGESPERVLALASTEGNT